MSPHGVAATASISSPIEEEAIEHTTVPNFDSTLINTSSNKSEPVFALIQRIRKEIQTLIDTPLTYEQFKTPAINFSVVRPLLVKLSKGKQQPPAALIYALLINRVQFKNEAELDLAFVGVQTARADLCELLATKLLSAYSSTILLDVLTTNFNPFNAVTLDMFADHEGVGLKLYLDLVYFTDSIEFSDGKGRVRRIEACRSQRIFECSRASNFLQS